MQSEDDEFRSEFDVTIQGKGCTDACILLKVNYFLKLNRVKPKSCTCRQKSLAVQQVVPDTHAPESA